MKDWLHLGQRGGLMRGLLVLVVMLVFNIGGCIGASQCQRKCDVGLYRCNMAIYSVDVCLELVENHYAWMDVDLNCGIRDVCVCRKNEKIVWTRMLECSEDGKSFDCWQICEGHHSHQI